MHDITFQCSQCRGKLSVRRSSAGQRTHCPHCGAQIVVPGSAEQAPAARTNSSLASTQRIADGPAGPAAAHRAALMTTQKIQVETRGTGRELPSPVPRAPAPPPKLGFSDLIQNLQRENEELRRQLQGRSPVPAAPPAGGAVQKAELDNLRREIDALRARLESERRRADDAVKSAHQLASMFEGLNTRAVQARSLAETHERLVGDLTAEVNQLTARCRRIEQSSSESALQLNTASTELGRLRNALAQASLERDCALTDAVWHRQQVRILEQELEQSAGKGRGGERQALPGSERTMLMAALAEVEDRARRLQAERDEAARSGMRVESLEQENAFLREQLEFASAVSLDIQRSRELVEALTAQNKALEQTVRALTLGATSTPPAGESGKSA